MSENDYASYLVVSASQLSMTSLVTSAATSRARIWDVAVNAASPASSSDQNKPSRVKPSQPVQSCRLTPMLSAHARREGRFSSDCYGDTMSTAQSFTASV